MEFQVIHDTVMLNHRLGTPNEGINQTYLKNWSDWQTQYASVVCTLKFGSGSESLVAIGSEGYILSDRP